MSSDAVERRDPPTAVPRRGEPRPRRSWRRPLLIVAGPVAYLLVVALAPPSLNAAAAQVLGITAWMAVWWLTEVVPLAVTSLLPIVLFPLFGVMPTGAAAAPYANEIVFLFLAGFLLAAALERWRAHVRIAYTIVLRVGLGGRRLVLGMMVATAVISMWISNTATAAMMYPIALAIAALFADDPAAGDVRTALMLGVAYAASIGGVATLIGTPPNLVFAGAARELLVREVGFAQFLLIGLPIAAVLLPIAWALLVFVLHRRTVSPGPEAARLIRGRLTDLGPLRGGEAATVALFAVVALAWLLRERKEFGPVALPGLVDVAPGLSDAAIGIAGAILLFILRGRDRDGVRRPLLTWEEAVRIPWGVLLLFGGGLSLAAGMESTGLATWLGERLTGLGEFPPLVIFLGLAVGVLLLSELASNTATAAMAMPIAATLGTAVGQPPLALMLVAALAASTGFALPIATPPNAIVFGSGFVSVRQMARAGILLDLVSIVVIASAVRLLYPLVFG